VAAVGAAACSSGGMPHSSVLLQVSVCLSLQSLERESVGQPVGLRADLALSAQWLVSRAAATVVAGARATPRRCSITSSTRSQKLASDRLERLTDIGARPLQQKPARLMLMLLMLVRVCRQLTFEHTHTLSLSLALSLSLYLSLSSALSVCRPVRLPVFFSSRLSAALPDVAPDRPFA
jgi:hypothetical protein